MLTRDELGITERREVEEALRASEARFRHLTALSSDWYWELDEQLRFKVISGAGLAAFGLKPDDVLGLTRSEASGSRYELLSPSEAEFERLRAEHRPYSDVRGRFVHADGTFRYVSINGEPVFGDDGTFCGYRGVTRDITDQARTEIALRESETQFRLAFDNSPIGMALVRPDGHWLRVNDAVCALVGYSREELLALSFQDITHPEDLESDLTLLQDVLDDKRQTYQMDKRYVCKNGAEIWIQLNVSLVRDAAGKPLYFISQIQDISARRNLQERTERLALHDALTGLANSRLLLDRLERTIAAAQRTHRMAGVVFLDLDGFKSINDAHGHAAGDAVLKELAGRLAGAVRNVDTVGRVGGDEFVVVLGDVESADGGKLAAERILAAFEAPFMVKGTRTSLGASLGVALYPDHGGDAKTLLQSADSAMYRAKGEGTNMIRFPHRTG